MRKKLLIVGAGGLGRIVYDVLLNDVALQQEIELCGFLDTRRDVVLPAELTVPVLGSPLDYQPADAELFIPAVGNLAIIPAQGLNPGLLEFGHASLGAFQFLAILATLVFLLHASGDGSSFGVPRRLRIWTSSATISQTPRSWPSSS